MMIAAFKHVARISQSLRPRFWNAAEAFTDDPTEDAGRFRPCGLDRWGLGFGVGRGAHILWRGWLAACKLSTGVDRWFVASRASAVEGRAACRETSTEITQNDGCMQQSWIC